MKHRNKTNFLDHIEKYKYNEEDVAGLILGVEKATQPSDRCHNYSLPQGIDAFTKTLLRNISN